MEKMQVAAIYHTNIDRIRQDVCSHGNVCGLAESIRAHPDYLSIEQITHTEISDWPRDVIDASSVDSFLCTRQGRYHQSCEILDRRFNHDGGRISREEAGILREAWDGAKTGNNLLAALEDTIGYSGLDEVDEIVFTPGFLTPRELWHTKRLKHTVVTIYRGCDEDEAETTDDSYGYSWTLNREVAEFFAWRRPKNGHVLTAQVPGHLLAWLDSPESEVVAIGVESSMGVTTRKHQYGGGAVAWSKMRVITSGQAAKMGLVQRK